MLNLDVDFNSLDFFIYSFGLFEVMFVIEMMDFKMDVGMMCN